VLEHRGISITESGRTLAGNATLVEHAEPATGEPALQRAGERGRDGLAHRHAREVGNRD
jgi:hypothetical protein